MLLLSRMTWSVITAGFSGPLKIDSSYVNTSRIQYIRLYYNMYIVSKYNMRHDYVIHIYKIELMRCNIVMTIIQFNILRVRCRTEFADLSGVAVVVEKRFGNRTQD